MNLPGELKKPDAPHYYYKAGSIEILVIGTAHVSRQSVEDTRAAFEDLDPDAVCVELCRPRYDSMQDPDRWRKLDLSKLVKEKKLGLLASSLILSAFQKKVGMSTGIKPGEEMMVASQLAESNDKKLVLADREIRTTLSRAWSRVGFFSKLWLMSTLMTSLLVREDVGEEEIERLKQDDVLTDLFTQLPRRYDRVKEVIIDERDSYLAESILQAAEELAQEKPEGGRVLAIVGAGHLAGIQRAMENGERSDLDVLDEPPPRQRLKNAFSWLSMSVGVLLISWYIGEDASWAKIKELVIFWAICRSLGAGIGALISMAHPLTSLVTIVMAPFSFFILGSRLWMYSALTELWFKKPRVEDFENIAQDTDTAAGFFRSLYRNRVVHLFFIIFGVSLGLTVGNFVFWSAPLRELWQKLVGG